ncbi:MAG: complex I subunit 5 family protein [Spirochaetota bacterium]
MSLQNDIAVLLLVCAPLVAAVVSLSGKFLKNSSYTSISFLIWLGGSLYALAVSAPTIFYGEPLSYHLGGWMEPYGIRLSIDGLTWIATLTDILIGTAAWLATRRYLRFGPVFYFFFFMALFSLQGILCTRDIFNLFIWFEVLSLSSFLLISYDHSMSSRLAAVRYLLISSLSIIFFLIGVWILYRLTGTLSLETMAARLPGLSSAAFDADSAIGLALALMSVGILTRAAIVPFHTWLPDAHGAAPYPVSALLSGFVIKAPMLAMWRIFDYMQFPGLMEGLVWLGGVCAIWGVAAAMVQNDAKKLLGYHSVSQMGYILAAFAIGGSVGRSAALFYIIAHALFKSLLFLTVGHVTVRVGTRNVYNIHGLARFFPVYTAAFMIGAAAISGFPLLAGFTGKVLVTKALYSHGAYYLLTAAGIGTAASFVKLASIFFGKTSAAHIQALEIAPADQIHAGRGKIAPNIGVMLISLGCILMGVLPNSIHRFILLLLYGKPEAPAAAPIGWYTPESLIKAAVTLGGGVLIAFFLLSPQGKQVSHQLRRYRVGLNGSLRLLVSGSIAVLLFGLITY